MEDALALPGKVRKSTRWAVWNDLFHPNVPDSFIAKTYEMIYGNPRHTFLVLTKQAQRLFEWHTRSMYLLNAPLPNLWIGVTAENQTWWDIEYSISGTFPPLSSG
jgi:protein gp37